MFNSLVKIILSDNTDTIIELDSNSNTLIWDNGELKKDILPGDTSTTILIVITAIGQIRLICVAGNVMVDDAPVAVSSGVDLIDGSIIQFGRKQYKLRIEYDNNRLEELLEAYLQEKVKLPIDLDNCFLNYAKQLKITEKTAISAVMAAIDIPEIDIIRKR